MVTLNYLQSYFKNKKVFLTGHTGFKGTWLLQILNQLGANVRGFSLAPEHDYDLYYLVNGDSLCEKSVIHDIRDSKKVKEEILDFQPDFVFHLAAQPLVLEGYAEPLYTFEVNAQGTANVLDALRFLEKKCIAVMVTTDKVYENKDDHSIFKEDDKLGGYDPYSASKAACEIVISSYRSSFFNIEKMEIHKKSIVSVRAGNVIGGGDFADNRIIPDIIKSIQSSQTITLRNPHATRPWQHVLEPLSVYLFLATKMFEEPGKYNSAYNIGPEKEDELSVETLTKIAIEVAQKGEYQIENNLKKPHEAATLMLDITKLKNELGWNPKFNATRAIRETMEWYLSDEEARQKCEKQIQKYFN